MTKAQRDARNNSEKTTEQSNSKTERKRAYSALTIEVLCSVAEVVMSPSTGVFESGPGNGFRS